MTRLVVDSSVVIKWSIPEVHSADALRYLDPDLERDAPELLLAEAGNMVSGGQADSLDRREFCTHNPVMRWIDGARSQQARGGSRRDASRSP